LTVVALATVTGVDDFCVYPALVPPTTKFEYVPVNKLRPVEMKFAALPMPALKYGVVAVYVTIKAVGRVFTGAAAVTYCTTVPELTIAVAPVPGGAYVESPPVTVSPVAGNVDPGINPCGVVVVTCTKNGEIVIVPPVGTAVVETVEYWNDVAERPTGDTIAPVTLIPEPPVDPATVNLVPAWNVFGVVTTTGA
jgi:hypothetical protein